MKTILLATAVVAAGAVFGALPEPTLNVMGIRCWRDISYGPRADLPDEGAGFKGATGGWTVPGVPWRISTHRSGQFLDLYLPEAGVKADASVFVYLHGGAWSQCFDKDAVPLPLFKALLGRGAAVVSVDYILQSDNTINRTKALRKEATFGAMLADVDAALVKAKALVAEAGVTSPRFVLGGESAGAHLALLYAYDETQPTALGLGLGHKVKVGTVVDIVGPTDFGASDFVNLKPAGLLKFLSDDAFPVLLKRLSGQKDDADPEKSLAKLERWSPVRLVSRKSARTVLAYGEEKPGSGGDGLIPLTQKTSLEKALTAAGVPFESKVFTGANHGGVNAAGADWIAERALATGAKEKSK